MQRNFRTEALADRSTAEWRKGEYRVDSATADCKERRCHEDDVDGAACLGEFDGQHGRSTLTTLSAWRSH